jgi:hypothetical protein
MTSFNTVSSSQSLVIRELDLAVCSKPARESSFPLPPELIQRILILLPDKRGAALTCTQLRENVAELRRIEMVKLVKQTRQVCEFVMQIDVQARELGACSLIKKEGETPVFFRGGSYTPFQFDRAYWDVILSGYDALLETKMPTTNDLRLLKEDFLTCSEDAIEAIAEYNIDPFFIDETVTSMTFGARWIERLKVPDQEVCSDGTSILSKAKNSLKGVCTLREEEVRECSVEELTGRQYLLPIIPPDSREFENRYVKLHIRNPESANWETDYPRFESYCSFAHVESFTKTFDGGRLVSEPEFGERMIFRCCLNP